MAGFNENRTAARKHTMKGQNILRGGGKYTFGVGVGAKYTQHKKINSNSENFRGSKITAS